MPAIQEKQLQMPDQNNPQIREYIDAIERGKDTMHIFPTERGWKLKKIGGNDLGTFDTEKGAILAARLSHSGTNSVITHDEKGLISGTVTFPHTALSPAGTWNFWSWFR